MSNLITDSGKRRNKGKALLKTRAAREARRNEDWQGDMSRAVVIITLINLAILFAVIIK